MHIVEGVIEPNDIKQGQIGDCYFLSSLAALAEKPERIRDLFLSQEANQYGVYGANLFKNGIKMIVLVDDLIPCLGKNTSEIEFSKSKGSELWVVLLEKIWAKLHGNYDKISGGL